METDISVIYEHLREKHPINLSSSLDRGFKSGIDFPVLHGCSVLGEFELIYDGVSFPFYIKREDGELIAHWHSQTLEEAEQTVEAFMVGKLQFEKRNNP